MTPLDQSLLLASDVFCQEHASKFGKGVGLRIVERPKQSGPVVDQQRENHGSELECFLEHTPRRLVDEAGELPNVVGQEL